MTIMLMLKYARIGRFRYLPAVAVILSSLCLEGPGLPALAKNVAAPPLGPEMRFVVARAAAPRCDPVCPEWISAEGSFVPDTPRKLEQFLKKLGDRKLPIVMDSPGGEVQAAMDVAKIIRAKGLDVAVGRTVFTTCTPEQKGCDAETNGGYAGTAVSISAMCFSACALAITGGVNRLVGPHASLGVHQITTYVDEVKIQYRLRNKRVNGKLKKVKEVVSRKRTGVVKAVDVTKKMRKELTRFYDQMGVSPNILPLLEQTPRRQIRVLLQQELLAMKVTTTSGGVDLWTDPTICEKPEMPSNCRRVPSPPTVRIVTSRNPDCPDDCGKWIALEGDIDQTAVPKLSEALEKVPGATRVVLSSRGGDLESAFEFGRFLRSHGLTVIIGRTISSRCRARLSVCDGWSADDLHVGTIENEARLPYCTNVCVFALIGGEKRIVGARTGVNFEGLDSIERHPAGKTGQAEADPRTMLSAYLGEMGFDLNVLDRFRSPKSTGSVRVLGAYLQSMGLTTIK